MSNGILVFAFVDKLIASLVGVVAGVIGTLVTQRISRSQLYASGRASTYGQLLRVLDDRNDSEAQVAEPKRIYSEMWHKVVNEHHDSEAKRIVVDELPSGFDDAARKVDSDGTLMRRLREAVPKDTGRNKRFLGRLAHRR